MKAIMRNLIGALLIAAAALGTGRPQSAAQEIRLSDIRAQQSRHTIFASAPCQRARAAPRGLISPHFSIDPNTLVQDLNTLMEKSDEVILAGLRDNETVISPSGKSTATYYEVRVIRSWKGSHHAGDVLTFGRPGGLVECAPTGPDYSWFWAEPGKADWADPIPGGGGPYAYVLFLRQSKANERQLVQGLRLSGGEGIQGMFLVQVPVSKRYCAGVLSHGENVQQCEAYLETIRTPVLFEYARDPLAKLYGRMPFSDFLREVQSMAGGQ